MEGKKAKTMEARISGCDVEQLLQCPVHAVFPRQIRCRHRLENYTILAAVEPSTGVNIRREEQSFHHQRAFGGQLGKLFIVILFSFVFSVLRHWHCRCTVRKGVLLQDRWDGMGSNRY